MATPAMNPSLSTALHADPPSGAVMDASHAIADLLPSKELDVSTPPASSSSETINSKKEGHIEAPHAEISHTEAPHRSKGKVALIMSALCIAVFLAALDVTIVTTAIPTITARFRATQADYTWIGSAYLLAAAAATPLWGKFSDIWGRKPTLLSANLVFFVGSLIAALSKNVKMLIAARVIQGIGGGGLLILANICISDLFSMRERGKYFGMIGGVWGVASAVGPVLGGVFTQKVSWRWCFYINLPFDGLAFLIILFFLDIETPKTPLLAGLAAIDWLGSLTIVGGTIMFLLGLEYGGVTYPWDSATVICLIIFGLVVIGLFFINEWKFAKYPIMPLRIFKYRSNICSLMICFIHGMVFIAGAFFLPLYFQAVFGASPILSGVYLFPYVLSLSITSAVTGIFIKKTGQYLPAIWFGMTVITLGFGLFIDLPSSRHSWARVIIYQIIAGIGAGPNFQSPLIALQTKVHPKDIASATALFGFVRNLATATAVVLGGVIFQNGMNNREASLSVTLGERVAIELGGGGAGASTTLVQDLPAGQREAAARAYTDSLKMMWVFFTSIAAVGIVVSLMIDRSKLSKQHALQKTGLAEQELARQERLDRQAAKKLNRRDLGVEEKPKEEV